MLEEDVDDFILHPKNEAWFGKNTKADSTKNRAAKKKQRVD